MLCMVVDGFIFCCWLKEQNIWDGFTFKLAGNLKEARENAEKISIEDYFASASIFIFFWGALKV